MPSRIEAWSPSAKPQDIAACPTAQSTRSVAASWAGLVQPIGSVGDAQDNAAVESFWGTMQIELLNRQSWTTQLELSTAIVDWIEAFYNRRRPNSTLANISPIDFESRHQPTAA